MTAFFFGPFLLAGQPPDIGHFKGLAFSSATDRHPLEIEGGSLAKCQVDPEALLDFSRCEVEKGSLIVTGTQWNNLNVKLTSVTVLRTKDERNYYFQGTADLTIGGQPIIVEAKVTLTVQDVAPQRVRGFIELPVQAARSSVEAYLVR
jgi:hypothetical protein